MKLIGLRSRRCRLRQTTGVAGVGRLVYAGAGLSLPSAFDGFTTIA